MFDELDKKDILLHHPYDSFDAYIHWMTCACADPDVFEIYQTVYRMDQNSPVIEALKSAAKTKKVTVFIELRARFDELNNLRLTEELRSAGVQVTFGFGKLKLHAKAALICKDALHFFNAVIEKRAPSTFQHLMPAPTKLHKRLLQLIQQEALSASQGKAARIIVKVNGLIDSVVVDNLYIASQMGAKVDLIVRGACALIPGIKGLSENIRVISIVDRYLEHSRIYYFESSKTLFLSSADWMPRNFFSRLELAFPILDSRIFDYIKNTLLDTTLRDNIKARELNSKGQWNLMKPGSATPVRSQFVFETLANNQYQGTELENR